MNPICAKIANVRRGAWVREETQLYKRHSVTLDAWLVGIQTLVVFMVSLSALWCRYLPGSVTLRSIQGQ